MKKSRKIMLILLEYMIIVICFSCTQSYTPNVKADESLIAESRKNNKPKKINVYIDNTISMRGYLVGASDFRSIITAYLSQLNVAKITDSINIYYVNNCIGLAYKSNNKDKRGIYNYIDNMDIEETEGDIRTTKIETVLGNVLDNTKDDVVSIFISDCLFSPEKKDNYKNRLGNEASLITNDFIGVLNNRDFAVTIYKFYSNFSGDYYDINDTRIENIETIRPFYLWVMGNQKYVKNIVNAVNLSAITKIDAKGKNNKNYQIDYCSFIKPNQDVWYSLLPINNCRLLNKNTVSKLNTYIDYKSQLKVKRNNFYIGLNFLNKQGSYLNIDTTYLNDKDNYTIQSQIGEYKIYSLKNNDREKYMNIYPYLMTITSVDKYIKNADITLSLKYPPISKWINDINDSNGVVKGKIVNDKTFGFYNLVEAVYNAFTQNNTHTNIFEIKIKIKNN
jgi:hypothetical protein